MADDKALRRKLGLNTEYDPKTDYAKGILSKVAQGLTFNWSDEAVAKALELAGRGTYKENLERIRQFTKEFEAENPKAALAAELGGGLLMPGVGAAGLAGKTAVKGLPALAKYAGYGAATGALSGAGEAETAADMAGQAGAGALVGGALGAGLPVLGSALKGAAKGLWSRTPWADQASAARGAVNRAMEQDRISPQRAAISTIVDRSLGVPSTLGDAGRNLSKLREIVAQYPGKETQDLVHQLEGRMSGARERVAGRTHAALGGNKTYYETEAELVDALRRHAAENYDDAYKAIRVKETPELAKWMNRDIAKAAWAMADERANMLGQNPGRMVWNNGMKVALPPYSIEFIDHMKRGLDAMIRAEKDKVTRPGQKNTELGGIYEQVRRDFMDAVEKGLSDTDRVHWDKARKIYKGDLENIHALEFGKDEFFKLPPEVIRRKLREMSSSEREALKTGAGQSIIERAMNNPADMADEAKKVISSPYSRERLNLLFDDPLSAEAYIHALQRERELHKGAAKAVTGSPTGPRKIAQEVFEGADDVGSSMAGAVGQLIHNPASPSGWRAALDSAMRAMKMPEKRANEVARLLGEHSDEELNKIARELMDDMAKRKAGTALSDRAAAATAIGSGEIAGQQNY